MSTLRTNNLQNPDSAGVNIVMTEGGGAIFSGIVTAPTLNVTGVLTYDDVTNIDSVGVITARDGIHVTGGSVGIGTDNPGSLVHALGSYGTVRVENNNTAQYAASGVELKGPAGDERSTKIIHGNSNTGGTETYFQIEQYNAAGSYVKSLSTYSYQYDYWAFNTGGTERLRITSTGQQQSHAEYAGVGINTFASWARTGGAIRAEVGYNAVTTDYMYFGTGTNHPLSLRVNNDNALYIKNDSSRSVGIGTDNPGSKLTVYETGGNAKLQLQRSNTANNTDDYGSVLWRSSGGTAVGGINVARETGEDDGYMFFQTTESGSSMTERLRILADGTIRKGTANSGNAKAPVELFFQKRSTQIGKRVHQGSGVNATTHDILNIDSWQSANSHAYIYVTVYYVSPVANYGGRLECYATAVNSGGSVSGGQGTFQIATGGRWGNPGLPSLSWSGSTLQFTTLAHAYIDYSLDITCIAYDGAVVSYYSN